MISESRKKQTQRIILCNNSKKCPPEPRRRMLFGCYFYIIVILLVLVSCTKVAAFQSHYSSSLSLWRTRTTTKSKTTLHHPLLSRNFITTKVNDERASRKLSQNSEEENSKETFLSSKALLKNAEKRLQLQQLQTTMSSSATTGGEDEHQELSSSIQSRRLLFATALFTTAATLAAVDETSPSTTAWAAADSSSLKYTRSPVNKRSGVTVFDAEKDGYNVRFVTYLSRFLLCFDDDCQRWWFSRANDLPRRGTANEIDEIRLQQFASFSASVEVGLQEFRGSNGPEHLMESLLARFCPPPEQLSSASSLSSPQDNAAAAATARQQREIKEARRQIALLFGLMEVGQPVEAITKLLAAIDNGSVQSVSIVDPGSGYAPGYGAPLVTFPQPEAADTGGGSSQYETATGRAILRPNGRILRIDIPNHGSGYTKPPQVSITPPAIMKAGTKGNSTACAATAKAYVFKNGVNKGRLERIQLVDPGTGYGENEAIQVTISPPDLSTSEGGVQAVAKAVPELEVGGIEIINPGSGYAVEKPMSVQVDSPPVTSRYDMNDPLRIPAGSGRSSLGTGEKIAALATNEGKGGGGGCIGRACYDRPVEAVATIRAEMNSYKMFRNEDDAARASRVEESSLSKRNLELSTTPSEQFVSASSSGPDGEAGLPSLPFWSGGPSTSKQLLTLLPAGIGLEYDPKLKRYSLAVNKDMDISWMKPDASSRALDPKFGPRGRSPIEREMELGIGTYLRFIASGAVCASAVHLMLTPIDVVKTKVQTDPEKYPNIVSALKTVLEKEGPGTFFTGWVPTFGGFFIWGGVSFAFTEFVRRYLEGAAGSMASSYEVPIILASSAAGAFVGSFILTPSEAVRIRSVAQPDFAPNILGVYTRIVAEEGFSSLFSALPAFLVKELPFGMAKFTVFDLSTAYMYNQVPAAREDIKLSLFVSLAGGTLGGICAAVVSNPGDATISEMKKAKTDMTPLDAAKVLLERGGAANFFRGLPLRMVFYSLLVSLQFFVYDGVRFALGIGADDLKLYLDVLGGALRESGGPV